MKKLFTVSVITFLIGYLNYFDINEGSFPINFNDKNLSGNYKSAIDSFEVTNIYSLGTIPSQFGFPDTIGVHFKKHFSGLRQTITIIIAIVHPLTGQIKFIYYIPITTSNTKDTVVKQEIDDGEEVKNDLVIVHAIPFDTSLILKDNFKYNAVNEDTTNNRKIYCRNTTLTTYNHADPCVADSTNTGFTGRTGNIVSGFRNNSSSSIYIKQIEQNFLDSTGSGNKPYKVVIYGDNGSGKPGTLLHSSQIMNTPSGTGQPVKLVHTLDTSVNISGNSKFFVGYKQTSNQNIKVACQREIPVRKGSFYFSSPESSTNWYDFNDSSKNELPDISVIAYSSLLNITVVPEGLYDQVNDTIRVFLRSNTFPYAVVDSAVSYNTGGNAKLYFSRVSNGIPYYIEVNHRNSIETWSSSAQSFTNHTLTYNFTSSSSQAYGNNMVFIGNKWCIFSGDINDDGTIDVSDLLGIYNDAANFITGYVNTDLNGDYFVDISDLVICYNNSINFVSKITP